MTRARCRDLAKELHAWADFLNLARREPDAHGFEERVAQARRVADYIMAVACEEDVASMLRNRRSPYF